MSLSAEAPAPQGPAPTPFWQLAIETSTLKRLLDAHQRDPSSVSVVNRKEAHLLLDRFRHRDSDRSYLTPLAPDAAISIELEMRAPGFAPDYFLDSGYHFVSARFREAARFPDGAVSYLDAPCLRCTPEAAAQDYKAMWVNGFEDVIDRERSEILPPERLPDRSTYVIRDDLSVSAPIFQPGLNAWVMLTDDAARRLAAAHLEGVAFRDVTRYRPDGQFVRLGD